jgi:hypothetical protein
MKKSKKANINREHKDSVFSLLFSDPDILRELYSAIEGIDLPSLPGRTTRTKALAHYSS